MANSNTETFDSIGITNKNANSGNTYSDGNIYPSLRYRDQIPMNPISKTSGGAQC